MQRSSSWNGGHSESILALDVSSSGVLASGGEDCLCVWTREGSPLSKIHPPSESTEITSVCFCRQNPDRLFVSSGSKIFHYDLRSLDGPVCEFHYNEDEINQLAVHDKGQYLAACDDTGTVRIIDTRNNKLFKTLGNRHDNICSSVQFRPHRPWELLSGGMDFKVVYSDFASGRVLQDLNMREEGEEDAQAYFVNPPFVHSLHVNENSRAFATGLGDGSIQLFHFEGRKKFLVDQRLRGGHTQGVSQVHFPRCKHTSNFLISGGNDGNLVLWNINDRQNTGHHSTNGDSQGASNVQDSCVTSINCTVQHGSKVNWITSYSGSKNFVFVSDQTSQISVYETP